MDTLLSLDSHYMLFDEAEKDFDIDSFLAPYFPTDPHLLKTDEEIVFGSPPQDYALLPTSGPLHDLSSDIMSTFPPYFDNDIAESQEQKTNSSFSDSMDERSSPKTIKEKRRSLRATRPKKRRRAVSKKDVDEEEVRVSLSQLDLLHLSSSEYENLVRGISSSRDLSSNEKQQLTRQRRLIKNRESAQASRQRKKSYIEDLERKVNELVNENAHLKETVSTLTSDKNRLEVLLVQQTMGDKKDGINLGTDMLGIQFLSNKNGVCFTKPNQNNKTTVIVLMIILFSFGLLFHQAASLNSSPHLKSYRNLDVDAGVIPKKIQKRDRPPNQPPGLEDTLDLARPHIQVPVQALSKRRIRAERVDEKETAIGTGKSKKEKILKTSKRVVEHEKPEPSSKVTKHKRGEPSSSPSPPKTSSQLSQNTDLTQIGTILRPEIQNWKKNTTYLLCANVSEIIPPASVAPDDPYAPLMVSFLIPPDSFNTTCVKENSGSADAAEKISTEVLEVTCQVVDVCSIPLKRNHVSSM